MRFSAKIINSIVMLLAVLLLPANSLLHAQSEIEQPAPAKQEKTVIVTDLAEIIPLASELSGSLLTLQNKISDLVNVGDVQEKYADLAVSMESLTGQLEQLKESTEYKYNRIVSLGEKVKQKEKLYDEISRPVSLSIRQLDTWNKEWLAEKMRWSQFETSLLTDEKLVQLKPTFVKANKNIDTALELTSSHLETILTVQEQGGNIKGNINELQAELNGLVVEERRSALLNESVPLLSFQFFAQFKTREMWYAVAKSVEDAFVIDSGFIVKLGWIVLIQVILYLFVAVTVFRNRKTLSESKRWMFLAARPFSTAFFLAFMATILIYEYQGADPIWKLINTIIAGISFVRLMGSLIVKPWHRQFVQGAILILISTRILEVLNFPLPLYRLYIVTVAIAGLIFCLRLVRKSVLENEKGSFPWLLRAFSLFFGVIVIAQFWGNKSMAAYLFVSLVYTLTNVLVFILVMHMIRGGLEWIFRNSPLRRVSMIHKDDTDIIINRMAHYINGIISMLVLLPSILIIWGFYENLEDATRGLLELGFNFGELRINIGLLLVAISIYYGSFFFSWIIQKLFLDEVLFKRQVEIGARLSMARLANYAIMLVGFLFAISALGFEISKITIMLSALGVGIGFGLQGVVNNFVSGLILLFERPVRVGDMIELEGKWAKIKKIGLRATTVQTLDDADVIVPNADLVSNQVTNWTLSNRRARLIISVGVAYGSDVQLVMKTLVASAKDHKEVANSPSPQVLFLDFGESTLDFELRVWVMDAENRLSVSSDLRQEIDRRFREENIEIAFPQRDLHLRSVDESVSVSSPMTTV